MFNQQTKKQKLEEQIQNMRISFEKTRDKEADKLIRKIRRFLKRNEEIDVETFKEIFLRTTPPTETKEA